MIIEIDIWRTIKGKDGKPFCTIDATFNMTDKDIETRALEIYKQNYSTDDEAEYEICRRQDLRQPNDSS